MQRMKLSLACLLCLSLVGTVSAQSAFESDSGVVVMEDYSGSATFAGTYFDIRTMTGDGVGYRNGYTQIGAFMPIWMDPDRYFAPQSRLIITDLGDVGANNGLVYRQYKPEYDRIFGANLYFDYDQSVEGFTYHQVGFGLETLSDRWDARTNIYLPTTNDDNFVRPLALDCLNPILQGNAIGFLATGLYQQSLEGVDFEVGRQLTKSAPWLRGYVGAYFYDAPKDNPIGVRARIDAQISNDFSVGVNVTNDTNFGTNVNAVVDFRFSGWLPTRYFPNYTTHERMLTQVQRNWRITAANTARDEFAPAKNPDTGLPYFIVWVDSSNNLPGPGTGTFENPFDDVPNVAPGADIVAVKVGDSTLLNPYRASIVLQDNQRLLGDGKAHEIDLLPMYNGLMCPVATYTIPGFTDDGNFPYLTSIGNQNVVTLQDNNEVSAFNIVRAGGFAITNFPGLGSRDFDLNCLNLINNTAGGIGLTNASGTGIISMVNAINNTGGGISIDSAPAGLNLTITDTVSSSVAASPGFPQAFGLRLIADPGQITANITNSEFNRNTVGVILNGAGGDLDVSMTDVSVNNNITDGVQLTTVNSDVDLELRTSTFNGNGGFGLVGIMTGGSLDVLGRNVTFNNNDADNMNLGLVDTRMAIDFRNATFNNSSTGSGIVISNSGSDGVGTAVFENITSTGNFLDGFQFNGDDLADISASVRASVLSNNLRDAFSVSGTNGADVGLAVTAVVATNSGRHGLNFNSTSGADLDIDFLASNLDFSGSDAALAGRGVNGFADAGNVSLTMVNTSAENSGADGMHVTALNNAQVAISVQNGNFANSGQNTPGSDGVHIVTDTGADLVMQINNTPINNSLPVPAGTQDDGLVFESSNNSTVLANISSSDLSNNLSNALEATVNSGAQVTVNLLNSNGLNSGEDGIRFDVQTGGQLTINTQSSNFDFSGQSGTGNGILGFVRTGGDVTMNMLDSSVSNSAENGFELDIANIGSSFTANIESGNFSDSGRAQLGLDRQDAFHITAGDQALVDIALFTTPSANTGGLLGTQQRGLWATINTGADLVFDDASGDLSGNLLNAINISVANAGSTALLNITDTSAANSGEDGFIFNVVDSAILNANFLRSSLDSSGLAGLPGDEFDAIDGTLDTSGVAVLDFTDTSVTNAFSDGMRVVGSNNALLVATFDNSPLDGSGTNNSGDAVRLTFDSGADAVVSLLNGSTATDAGDDAVFISATNAGTNVVFTADGSNFSDSGTTATANGGNGFAVFVSDNANVTLDIANSNINNTIPTTPQQRGLLFDVQSGGFLSASFNNSPMNGHDLEGINGSVDGAGIADSTAIITLVDSEVDNNVTFGAIFNVSNDGDLALDASGTSSFSNNGATGILVNVDGAGSTFDIVLDGTTVDSNGFGLGGDGIAITGDNGAFISGDITNASISNNANAGVVLTLLNGSTANLAQSIVDTDIDGNGDQGLLAIVESGSILALNVVGGSISDNGLNGTFDNVQIFGTDAGTMIETSFQGTIADNSTRNGFNFTTLNGAMNLTQMRAGVSGSNNANGSGLRFVADGAATQAVLFMSDTSADGLTTLANTFSDNGTAVITANGGPDQDEPLLGAGIFFQATNVDVAAVRVSGMADNNGNTNDLLVNRDIDGDGDGDHDGIFINVDGANQFAFEIDGSSSASNNVDQGIDINVMNVASMAPVTKASVITPPDVTIGADGIVIRDVVAENNNGPGISVVIDGPTTIGDIVVDNVSSTDNTGDGFLLQLTDVAGTPDLTVTNSQFSNNGGHGFNIDLTNSDLGDVLFADNIGVTTAAVGFQVDVSSVHWEALNLTPDPTVLIDSLVYDIGPTGLTFATTRGLGTDFQYFFNGPETGFQTVNGLPVDLTMTNQPGVVQDGDTVLTLGFNDFDNGDGPLHFDLRYGDALATTPQTGNELSGATVTAFFSNGQQLTGVFDANNTHTFIQAAQVGGIAGNAGDGIHIEQVNSDIGSFTADNNSIAGNGTSGTGSGINFAVMTNSDLGPIVLTANEINDNNDDGFRLVNAGPTGGLIDLTVDQNVSISNNGAGDGTGRGINVQLLDNIDLNLTLTDNAAINGNGQEGVLIDMGTGGTLNATVVGNTINNNGLMGINFQLPDASNSTINFGDSAQAANTLDGNGGAGMNIAMTGSANATLNIQNSTFSNTQQIIPAEPLSGDGVHIDITDTANLALSVGTPTGPSNTFFTGNDDDGFSLGVNGSAQLLNPTFQNITANNNGQSPTFLSGAGLIINRAGNGNIDNVLIEESTFNGNVDGIRLGANSTTNVDEFAVLNNTINNNSANGINLQVAADAQFLINFQSNDITNNGGRGILMTEEINAPLDDRDISGLIFDNVITGNGAEGIEISARHGNVGGLLILQNDISNNGQTAAAVNGDGIEINRLGFSTIQENLIDGNGGSGINVNAGDNVALNVDFGGTTSVNILNNMITNNDLKGIELTTDINDTVLATIQGNVIQFNTGDGIELVNNGFADVQIGDSAGGVPVAAAANLIADNGGRGVDILNREFGTSIVDVLGNRVERNGLEGVYVVNTPTATQASDVDASVIMQTTTNFDANPITVLTVDANEIRDNGQNSGFDTTGLVVRVGTSDAFSFLGAFADDGGLASNGPGGNGVFDLGDSTFRGGVLANVTNNAFSGAFGNDVTFQSFVGASTVASNFYGLAFGTMGEVTTTTGSWTDQNEAVRNNANDVFDTDTFVQDPLARLDLLFTNNTGLSLDVTRQGAAYDNAEAVFKSRTIGQDNNTDGGVDDNGPFTSGTRRRNAQRLAARFVDDFPAGGKLDPQLTIAGTGGTPGTSDNFLFSGMGTSTFRVTNTSSTAGFTAGDTFILDNAPFDQTSIDSFGIGYPGVNLFGENPFGWSLIP